MDKLVEETEPSSTPGDRPHKYSQRTFDKGAGTVFATNGPGTTGHPQAKI